MSKRILMVVTSHDHITDDKPTGLWFEEFATPYQTFNIQGYTVTVASPQGGRTPIDPSSKPTDVEREKYQGALDILENTTALSSIDPDAFDAVFLPGGHGTMYDLPTAEVGRIIGRFADADKVIASVCHGPAGLIAAKRADGTPIVRGYQLTAFTNEEEVAANLADVMPFLLQDELTALGAEFIVSPMWNNHVVIDRNLITGQNPQSAASTAQAMIDVLEKRSEPT